MSDPGRENQSSNWSGLTSSLQLLTQHNGHNSKHWASECVDQPQGCGFQQRGIEREEDVSSPNQEREQQGTREHRGGKFQCITTAATTSRCWIKQHFTYRCLYPQQVHIDTWVWIWIYTWIWLYYFTTISTLQASKSLQMKSKVDQSFNRLLGSKMFSNGQIEVVTDHYGTRSYDWIMTKCFKILMLYKTLE